MKKIVLLLMVGLFLTTANAAEKKSKSWIPYSEYIKTKAKTKK